MSKKVDKTMGTQPVRIDTGIVGIVRAIKENFGFPIGRFIEDAIIEKVERLPKEQKDKLTTMKVIK